MMFKNQSVTKNIYSRVRNKHSPTLINFLTFFQGLHLFSGLHRAYLSSLSRRYKRSYTLVFFCQIFQGLCLFKGLRLFQTLEYVLNLKPNYYAKPDSNDCRMQNSHIFSRLLIFRSKNQKSF